MAVPKKRKKLIEKSENLKKTVRARSQKSNQKPLKLKAIKKSSEKIDEAFEIMTHIENKNEKAAKAPKITKPVDQKKPSHPKPPSDRLGFRFHVSLDALMPNKPQRNADKKKQPVKESPVIDIDLTIPFLWDMPIIGGITQKIFKNFKTIKF